MSPAQEEAARLVAVAWYEAWPGHVLAQSGRPFGDLVGRIGTVLERAHAAGRAAAVAEGGLDQPMEVEVLAALRRLAALHAPSCECRVCVDCATVRRALESANPAYRDKGLTSVTTEQ